MTDSTFDAAHPRHGKSKRFVNKKQTAPGIPSFRAASDTAPKPAQLTGLERELAESRAQYERELVPGANTPLDQHLQAHRLHSSGGIWPVSAIHWQLVGKRRFEERERESFDDFRHGALQRKHLRDQESHRRSERWEAVVAERRRDASSLAEAAVPRDRSEAHAKYYSQTDTKHFGDRDQPGSKFLDPNLARVEDVVALAAFQRGNLQGDDRERFIALGADRTAFQDGNRYLFVETPGTVGVIDTDLLCDDDVLEVVRTKEGAPCTLVATVAEQTTEDYAVVIVATDEDTDTDLVITTFPGVVTMSSKDERIEALEGGTITVGEARRILGSRLWVNTKVL